MIVRREQKARMVKIYEIAACRAKSHGSRKILRWKFTSTMIHEGCHTSNNRNVTICKNQHTLACPGAAAAQICGACDVLHVGA